jgi:hypothetical protein
MSRLLVLVALGALLTGCTAEAGDDPVEPPAAAAPDSPLDPCPEQADAPVEGDERLPALAFDCLGGGRLDLSRAPGTPTLVNLWAS